MFISELSLNTRASLCIERLYRRDCGIRESTANIDVQYLCNKTREELRCCPNLGDTTLREIVKKLSMHNLKLNTTDEEIFPNIVSLKCPCCGTKLISRLNDIKIINR